MWLEILIETNDYQRASKMFWTAIMTHNSWSLSKDIFYCKLISNFLQTETAEYSEKNKNAILHWAFDKM